MKCIIIIVIITTVNIPGIFANAHQKCCSNGQQIQVTNSTWICRSNSNKRLQSTFDIDNFLKTNTNGTCVEAYHENNTAIFVLDENKNVSEKEQVKLAFFPKCCHLGHKYDPKLHSCPLTEPPSSIEEHVPRNSFVYVGLPSCKIIQDVVVASLKNFTLSPDFRQLTHQNRNVPEGNFCIDSTVDSRFVLRICEKDFQICDRLRCVQKCCNDGQSFVNGSKCKDTFRYGVNLHASTHVEEPDVPFAIIYGFQKPLTVLRDKQKFKLDRNGIFWAYTIKTDSYTSYPFTKEKYCIEHAYRKRGIHTVNNYTVFLNFETPPMPIKFTVTRWVKIVSCIFLLLTILVYAILPKLRNLFGKILLSYCVATFLMFFFLVINDLHQFSNDPCKAMGLFTILTSFWSFTWLHILCIDIWFSFGSPRTLSGPLQRKEMKRFLQYSIYGWGLPLLWILVIILFNTTRLLPASIQPFVGERKCYMETYDVRPGNYAFTLFVTLPVAIQQIINVILFIKTIIYCIKIKSEVNRMNDNKLTQQDYNAGKENLYLILKLAVVMGILFLFETISSIRNFNEHPVTEYLEVIWDTINCLQGVFIFIIFICKKKIYNDICTKLKIVKKYSVASSTIPGSMDSSCTKEEMINLEEKM